MSEDGRQELSRLFLNSNDRRSRAAAGVSMSGNRIRPLHTTLLFAALCLAGCATAGRNEPVRLPSRHHLKTGQLVIRSDFKLTEDDPLVAELHDLRREVRQTLELPPPQRTVVVYLFRDEDRYTQYMRKVHPGLPARRAFFIGTSTELAVYAYLGHQVQVDLRHEYTHGLLHASLTSVPLWLDEGLAEYFEVNASAPGRINQDHARGLAEMAAQGWRPDMARLDQLSDVSEMQRADYQEAWAWVHYLLHESADGRRLLLDQLAQLETARNPPPLAITIAAALPAAEERLTAYIGTFTTSQARARVAGWEQQPE